MLQGKIASLPTAPATTCRFTAHTAKGLTAPIGKRICKGVFCNTHTDLSAAATSESEFPTKPTHPLHERPQENRWPSLHAPSLPTPSFRAVIHHCHRILRRHSSPPNFSLRPFRHLPLHERPQENCWSSLHAPSLPTPSFRVAIHHCHRILRRHSSPPNFSLRPFRNLPLHERPQENRWSSLHAPSLPTPSFRVVIHHRHRILRRHSSPPNFSLLPFRLLPLHGKKPSSADCCTVTAWRNGKKNATKKRPLCRDRFNKIKHVSLRVLRQPWRRVP